MPGLIQETWGEEVRVDNGKSECLVVPEGKIKECYKSKLVNSSNLLLRIQVSKRLKNIVHWIKLQAAYESHFGWMMVEWWGCQPDRLMVRLVHLKPHLKVPNSLHLSSTQKQLYWKESNKTWVEIW